MTVVATPHALDSDVEDVAWALQTAGSLWKRGERVDAIVWLRRAAQAAGDAQQDERALALARAAAELSEWIAKNPMPPPSSMPSSIPPNDAATGGVDDLLRASMPDIPVEVTPQVSMSAMTEPHAFMPVGSPVAVIAPPRAPPPPAAATPPLPPTPVPPPPTPAPPPPAAPAVPVAPTTADLIPVAESSSVSVYQSVTSERSSENVQSAAEAHAGMLDPWSPPPEEDAPPKPVLDTSSKVVSSDDYDDEVVTSARLPLPPAEPAVVIHAPSLPKVSPPPKKPPPPRPAPSPPPGPTAASHDPDEASTAEIPAVSDATTAAAPPPAPRPASEAPSRPRAPGAPPAEPTLLSPGTAPRATGKVDLASLEALTDLPDDARGELERVATVHHLARDEEVMGFALAYVVEGEIDVAAQIVDAPADRIAQGAVLKAKGTVAESVPLRLVCASDHATVATWDAEQIEPAFRACPWVEDDLRAAANRMQALVGVTLGPLADRLDATLRAQVTSRLELRELPEGEIIVEHGEAVRDLCLVGQGAIELVQDGEVVGEVGVGEFLFPAEIMGGGKASATARAGKGGALLLASDRAVAQELMVTCPPLLEIFAGM